MRDAATTTSDLTSATFSAAYETFREIIRFNDPNNQEFSGFGSGVVHTNESYKQKIFDCGRSRLKLEGWSAFEPGSGQILERVIHAVEIPDNNVLFWHGGRGGPAARAHRGLIEAQADKSIARKVEHILKRSYMDGSDDERDFTELIEVIGRHYGVMAYLWFLKDIDRFLPVTTTGLEKGLAELGIDLRLSGNCSWANYSMFLRIQEKIRQQLTYHMPGQSVRLIDAHSFTWVLGHWERPNPNGPANQEPRRSRPTGSASAIERTAIRMRITIRQTVNTSNGQRIEQKRKNKQTDMSDAELDTYLENLISSQGGRCKLTGLPFQMDGEHEDVEMLASADRINSELGYVRGNIQIVCRFANIWKGASANEAFLRLISKVRASEPWLPPQNGAAN